MFLPSHLVTSATDSLSQLPGIYYDNLKGTHISTHKVVRISYQPGPQSLINREHSCTKCFCSNACQASPLCISYHSQRILCTLSVTSLLPNFILIYQWSSKGSKIQDCRCTGLTSVIRKSYVHLALGNVRFGNTVFADVIKLKWGPTRLEWAL